MTRKDYQRFAEVVAGEIESADLSQAVGELSEEGAAIARNTIRLLAYKMISIFEADNPRFDRDRFLIAAGIPR